MTKTDKLPIWRFNTIAQLTMPSISSGGKNNQGRITTFHRGGSVKRRYRLIDFRRRFIDIPALVIRLEKDPFRDAPLALLVYANGCVSYILAPKYLNKDSVVSSGINALMLPGCALPLNHIPIGQFVHNVENNIGHGGSYIRAAGTKSQIIRKTKKFTVLRLPSGELRAFNSEAYATLGVIEQCSLFKRKMTKAGNNRWIGKRPIVRGVAQNPIDHPHGGGEGKSSGGRHSCSPWGILTKGYKTRNPRKALGRIVRPRYLAKT